jgi:hypothetical protein
MRLVSLLQKLVNRLILLITLLCLNSETYILLLKNLGCGAKNIRLKNKALGSLELLAYEANPNS